MYAIFHTSKILNVSSDLDDPVVTVHQSIGEAKEQFYYERTVFLRCVANSNPPVRYSWHRGRDVLSQGSDKGVEIYEPFFTQVRELFMAFQHASKTQLMTTATKKSISKVLLAVLLNNTEMYMN